MQTAPETIEPVAMTATPESSNLESIGYDSIKQDLHVQFRDGALFVYHKVPNAVFGAFLIAPSKGAYFHTKIKTKFTTTKVDVVRTPKATVIHSILLCPGCGTRMATDSRLRVWCETATCKLKGTFFGIPKHTVELEEIK